MNHSQPSIRWRMGSVCALLLWLSLSSAQALAAPRITLISSSAGAGDLFWEKSDRLMQLVAEQLDLELEIIPAGYQPIKLVRHAEAIAKRATKPDYVIVVGISGASVGMLKTLDHAGIKTALFNGPLSSQERDRLSGQDALKHWVGQILPDERQAGYLLAQSLVSVARRKGLQAEDGTIGIYALAGGPRSLESQQRVEGLRDLVAESTDLRLIDVISANWNPELARAKVHGALGRAEDISVIWSASDAMVMGALKAAERKGRTPGADIILGGVDWADGAHPLIAGESLCCSAGGHLFDGAWILLALYDHYHGARRSGFQFRTPFAITDKNSIAETRIALDFEQLQSIDFKQWSAHHNGQPEIDYSAQLILDRLRDRL